MLRQRVISAMLYLAAIGAGLRSYLEVRLASRASKLHISRTKMHPGSYSACLIASLNSVLHSSPTPLVCLCEYGLSETTSFRPLLSSAISSIPLPMSVPRSMTLTYLPTNPGVDMAALVAAETCSLPYTGFVPLHYTNELGSFGIPARFHHALIQTSTTESSERTKRNIAAADGILTIYLTPDVGNEGGGNEQVSKGTQHGIEYALALGKRKAQLLFVSLPREVPRTDLEVPSRSLDAQVARVVDWIVREGVTRCAIGGPRESEAPGIQTNSFAFLCNVFKALKARNRDEMK